MRNLPDFRALFQASPAPYLVLAPDLTVVAVSNSYLRATLTERDAILGRGIFDVFPDNPDDPGASGVRNLRASLERVVRTRQPDVMAVQKYDIQLPGESGKFEERYWSPINTPVLTNSGELQYIIHRVEDVTEFIRLKKSGQEQNEAAQVLRDKSARMEAEIYRHEAEVADANRQLKVANEAMERLFSQIESLMAGNGAAATGPTPDGRGAHMSPEEMRARVEDLITGHKLLEEQLRQSQKMEAVGRLAGGVAHDFNNLLTVITGYASMLREGECNEEAAQQLEEIERASFRAAAMTHKLLAFSRKQVLQPQVINVNAVVEGMGELLRRLIGEDIQLVTILDPGLGNVTADPNQMEQVIMNLAVNARDAMDGGGRLTIETSSTHLETNFRSLQPGPYVLLSVTDTGCGMDEETVTHIFEPFFTTKDLGKGTGLGLATVYGIVEQTGGTITVESAPGAGATFRLYLPVSTSAVGPRHVEPISHLKVDRAARILVVEDEAPLRKLIAKVLAGAGFQVEVASSGADALAIAMSRRSIDLLLTDVVMPGMSGPELVRKLRGSRPELAVLYMSGYDRNLIDDKALERAAAFIPKPFTPRALLSKITELFGGPGDAESATDGCI